MIAILVMLLGVIIGYWFLPERFAKHNLRLQIVCIAVLIFAMGVKLGSRDNFLTELSTIGVKSAVFAVVSILCSVAIVYPLTQKFIKPKPKQMREGITEED